MKIKKYIVSILFILFAFNYSYGEEGMWLLTQMNLIEKDMQNNGLNLSAEEIYSINHSSIKDAVVSFGGFCTAEIVSDKGLLFTNHHCGSDIIREHSSIENNYLKNGFWAKHLNQELPNPNLYVKFLIEVKDVTKEVLKNVHDSINPLLDIERNKIIKNNIKNLITSLQDTNNTYLKYNIESMFGGNQFILFIYKYYEDVRLVGAPPESIGAFGGDTDNWMWPRHTGDFSIFRIYSDSVGNPSKYSTKNIPYKPNHFLPISTKGVKEGDFCMILGFPGSTDRFLTSYGVKEAIEITNPLRIKIRGKKLDVYKKFMTDNEEITLQYTDDYSGVSNYWKYYIGQTQGLQKNKIYDEKLNFEEEFANWYNNNDSLLNEYEDVLMNISDCYNRNKKINVSRIYLHEAIFSGPRVFSTAYYIKNIMVEFENNLLTEEDLAIELNHIYINHFHELNSDIDKNLFFELMQMYSDDLQEITKPDIFNEIEKRYNNNWKKFSRYAYTKSFLNDKKKFENFIKYPSMIKVKNDPLIKTFVSIYDFYINNMYDDRHAIRMELKAQNRQYIKGIIEMNPLYKFYPDANSTMRLTYGSISSYQGGDAINYNYYTTHEGILEKENHLNKEFLIPDELKKTITMNDFEKYKNETGDLVINFISNNDITGGNSGSPVLNGDGELIGIAFDGNWEAMSCDIAYEKQTQRTISVDIRYVLFVIEKLGKAQNLIDELTICD